jgi:hypothetical protein
VRNTASVSHTIVAHKAKRSFATLVEEYLLAESIPSVCSSSRLIYGVALLCIAEKEREKRERLERARERYERERERERDS